VAIAFAKPDGRCECLVWGIYALGAAEGKVGGVRLGIAGSGGIGLIHGMRRFKLTLCSL